MPSPKVLALAASLAAAIPAPFPLPQPDFETSVIGGNVADPAEFPYIVSLSTAGKHFCGGVLLDATHVLTAAHCSQDIPTVAVFVRGGTNVFNEGGKQVAVSSIFVHPDYDETLINDDMAVWTLSEPIPKGPNVKFAKLPESGSDPQEGTMLTVAGWGVEAESSRETPEQLMKVTVPVVSRQTCKEQYGEDAVTRRMFCAGLENGGKDACSGDSGGPMVDEDGTLIGIVSWGRGCARPGLSGVYARVAGFIPFINKQMNSS